MCCHTAVAEGGWAPADVAHSFGEAIGELHLRDWHKVTRHFRRSHVEQWWAAELNFLGYGPGKPVHAICATTDRLALPVLSTWYLTINLPLEVASLAEVMRLYGLRHWVEQGGCESILASCENFSFSRKRESIPPSNALWSPAIAGMTVEVFYVLEHGKAEYFHSLKAISRAALGRLQT